jgi:hypothetical protein
MSDRTIEQIVRETLLEDERMMLAIKRRQARRMVEGILWFVVIETVCAVTILKLMGVI